MKCDCTIWLGFRLLGAKPGTGLLVAEEPHELPRDPESWTWARPASSVIITIRKQQLDVWRHCGLPLKGQARAENVARGWGGGQAKVILTGPILKIPANIAQWFKTRALSES